MLSVAQHTHLVVLIDAGVEEFPPHLQDIVTTAAMTDPENCSPEYTAAFYFEPNTGRWIATGGGDAFLLLSSDVLDALVAEAHTKGYPVRYMDSRGHFVRV